MPAAGVSSPTHARPWARGKFRTPSRVRAGVALCRQGCDSGVGGLYRTIPKSVRLRRVAARRHLLPPLLAGEGRGGVVGACV